MSPQNTLRIKNQDYIDKYCFYILGSEADMNATIDLARKAIEVDGDFCECGSYLGGNCAIFGDMCKYYEKNKKIYLLDSFEGIPYPTECDNIIPGDPQGVERTGELKSTGVSIASLDTVEKVLNLSSYDRDNFIIIKGWLEDTLPKHVNTISSLALLRIDVDLYRPTKLCLDYLYDKVVSGGYIIVHDYHTLGGCKKAVDEFLIDKPEIKLKSYKVEYANAVYWRK